MPCASRTTNTDTSYVRCPVLTNYFGKSTARVLQQVHYWLSYENLSYGIIHNNHQWIRNSYNQWHQQIKKTHQDLAVITIRRAFSYLEKQGVVLSHCFDDHKKYMGGNQVKSYTIDYDRLESIVGDFKKTLISRPRSVQEQQSLSTTQTHKRAGDTSSFSIISVHTNTQNVGKKRASSSDQMSTPPDQMSTPLNRYISNKHSNKRSLFRAPQNIEQNQHRFEDAETIQPDKPAEGNKINFSEEMIGFWNEIVEENKPDRKISLTPKRAQQLNAAFKQFFENDISKWERFCHKITTCKFLMGEKVDFKANIDWTIRFEIIQRILEGGYSFGTRESNYTLKLSRAMSGGEVTTKISPTSFTPSLHESPKALVIRDALKKTIDTAQYTSWFLPTEIIVEENEDGYEETIICVQTRFMGERIKSHYRDICERYFNDFFVGSAEQYFKSKNIQASPSRPETLITQDSRIDSVKEHIHERLHVNNVYEENESIHIQSTLENALKIDTQKDAIDELPKTLRLVHMSSDVSLEANTPSESVLRTEERDSSNDSAREGAFGNDGKNSIEDGGIRSYSVALHEVKIIQLRKKMKQILSEPLYREWFENVSIVIEEGRMLLYVPTHSIKHLMQTQFKEVIRDFFSEVRVVGESESEIEHEIPPHPFTTATTL